MSAMTPRDRLLARLDELEKELDASLQKHSKYGIYDECGHAHKSEDVDDVLVFDVEDVGIVCEDGLTGNICKGCHTRGGEVDEFSDEGEWPCEANRWVSFLKPLLALARAATNKHTRCCPACLRKGAVITDCPVISKYAFLHESQVLEGK